MSTRRRGERAASRGHSGLLDDVGKRIVELMQSDGRRSYASVGTEVGLSEAAVRQRVQKLIEAGATLEDMMQWTNEPALLPRCPIGDWRGKPWAEVDDGFLHWILRKIFDRDDVRFCAQKELARREAEWKAQKLAQAQEQAHELEYRSGALF